MREHPRWSRASSSAGIDGRFFDGVSGEPGSGAVVRLLSYYRIRHLWSRCALADRQERAESDPTVFASGTPAIDVERTLGITYGRGRKWERPCEQPKIYS